MAIEGLFERLRAIKDTFMLNIAWLMDTTASELKK